jgi:hypothetical protein
VVASGSVKEQAKVYGFSVMSKAMHSIEKTTAHMSVYCPIRGISVERVGTRVKRFFVSEAQRAELKNLNEYRQSGTPGDFSGASFWYFLREKVQGYWGESPDRIYQFL